ncbi:L,D-transpeptidase family protein [Qingshengfaniella alkalisoli]|uniref:L,D-transpeptidase family protein n=2 Tax=Qingshengfaniella alkalisoli TaxID=2599296 RepID=A0A5B8I8A4_9RHOB|nr:L,D-transpeptidase family protein [Qingshengfaniella alkalisoli]
MGARFLGRHLPCSIGRGGITTNKREGDGATPIGAHRILGMMYRPDRMHAPASWAEPIRVGDLWSDASGYADYNQLVRAPYVESCEQMRRPDPLYDLVMVTDWNYPVATAGKGSAIFVHAWRKPRHPTAGCVAFSRSDLLWLAANIVPGTRLIVKP